MLTTGALFNPATNSCRRRLWLAFFLAFVFVFSSLARSVRAESAASPSPDASALASSSSSVSQSSTSGNSSVKTSVSVPASSIVIPAVTSIIVPGVTPTSTSTCPSRTVNYITHTLPQQCLQTNRIAAANHTVTISAEAQSENASAGTDAARVEHGVHSDQEAQNGHGSKIIATAQESGPASSSSSTETAQAEESDSPLDNANFLSFEEWKRQNLARLGQSLDGDGRPRLEGGRQRPDIVDTLGSLGEDGDFAIGFGFGSSGSDEPSAKQRPGSGDTPTGSEEKAAPSGRPRKKDAGTTCKERSNYASFDCAATVLKTNPKCKSSSSILVENKDSYMLNECSTDNKFLIVELCDDILVDTVVLANFEFFSSMFRIFRLSVSDRYPVKMDRWKELGVFEARNGREIQAFAIENPLIWARYLRVEFLSHYGAEFYCPVSLLRVHGTTMLDEMRNGEGNARGEDDGEEEAAAVPSPVEPATLPMTSLVEEKPNVEAPETRQEAESTPVPAETQLSSTEVIPVQVSHQPISSEENNSTSVVPSVSSQTSPTPFIGPRLPESVVKSVNKVDSPVVGPSMKSVSTSSSSSSSSLNTTNSNSTSQSTPTTATSQTSQSVSLPISAGSKSSKVVTEVSNQKVPASIVSANGSSIASVAKAQSSSQEPGKPSPVSVQPPSPSPTTQESFFKSFHKRLQVLEANATLSLQYIEEQSRILRDAFTKVEKRQTGKIDDFIRHLNDTVMTELKSFRQQYDQLWQSTVIELDTHRDRYQQEILAVSTRLSLLAEELVWQKRMAVVQSTLLVLCLGLIIFVRSGGGHFELPIMQHVLNKSHTVLGKPYDSPREMPSSKDSSPGQQARRIIRVRSVDDMQDSEDDIGLMGSPLPSPSVMKRLINEVADYDSTPIKNTSNEDPHDCTPPDTPIITPRLHQLLRPSKSGPATPRGTRDTQDPLKWVDRTLETSPLSRAGSINAAPEPPITFSSGTEDSPELGHINGDADSGTKVRSTTPAQGF